MLRMEIALILVLGFVAYIYYSAERTQTALLAAALAASIIVNAIAVALSRMQREA